MDLQLLAYFGQKKLSLPYQDHLQFDIREAEELLNSQNIANKELSYIIQILRNKRSQLYNEIRLEHALSTTLFSLGYTNISKGQLSATLLKIWANPSEKQKLISVFAYATAQITYQGRHHDLDLFVQKYWQDQPISYLDVGCCPQNDGAITTEETALMLPNARITAIDLIYPLHFKPKNSHINYIEGNIIDYQFLEKYDVIRYVNLELFFKKDISDKIRIKLLDILNYNGLYITGREAEGYSIYQKRS